MSLGISFESTVRRTQGIHRILTVFYATVGAMTSVMAAESDPWTYKFTPSFYATDHDRNAVDLNLRLRTFPELTRARIFDAQGRSLRSGRASV